MSGRTSISTSEFKVKRLVNALTGINNTKTPYHGYHAFFIASSTGYNECYSPNHSYNDYYVHNHVTKNVMLIAAVTMITMFIAMLQRMLCS